MSVTLILSAWEPEIAPLRRKLRGRSAIVCRTVGVGAVDAAVNAARAIDEVQPALAIFLGTAGAYEGRAAPAIGDVVTADKVVLVSTAALRGDGYVPGPMVVEAPATALPGSGAAATLACPLAITRTRALGRAIARATGAAVENLEAFAVARAAALAGVPFAAAVGVANKVGPRAHAEWLRHHQAASAAVCAAVWDWLRARRPGGRFRVK